MSDRKKILVCIDWFAPGYKAGGPIKSCINFAYTMKDLYDIYILTTDSDHGETKPYENIIANQWQLYAQSTIKVYYAQKKTLTFQQIKQQIAVVNPDYIYLNHLFSLKFVIYPLWLKWRGFLQKKIVICPQGALYESALKIKPYKKRPFLLLFRWLGIHKLIHFQATNEREKLAIEHYFPKSKITIAEDLPNALQPLFVTCRKEVGNLKCVFVARIHPIKNLLFLIEVLKEVKSLIELRIVGPIEDKVYWESCKEKITQLPSNITVNYLGALQNDKITSVLQQHHIFVLPTQGENFGHSIFEALLAGRPVLVSDQTPWLNLTVEKAGWDLPLSKPHRFIQALETAAAWEQQTYQEWAESTWKFANDFLSKSATKEQYYKLFT